MGTKRTVRLRGKGIRIKGDWVGVKVRVDSELPLDLQRVVRTPHVLTFGKGEQGRACDPMFARL